MRLFRRLRFATKALIVSLAFVVPVTGDCVPSTDALDLQWMTPEECAGEAVAAEMTGGQDRLLRLALASVGLLP